MPKGREADKKGYAPDLRELPSKFLHPSDTPKGLWRVFVWAPMLFALVATFCNTQPGPQLCVEEIVTRLPYHACTIGGQLVIAPWMADSKYRENWNLTGWKCETPDYVVKGKI